MIGNSFVQRAPENFLTPIHFDQLKAGRRGFLAGVFAAAVAGANGATTAQAQGANVNAGRSEDVV